MAPMLKRMRGRVRTVSALFPLPKGALVAGRSTGDCSFDVELAPAAYVWRFDLEGGSRFEINGRTLCSGNSTLASPGTRLRESTEHAAVLCVALDKQTVAHALGGDCVPPLALYRLANSQSRHWQSVAVCAAKTVETLGSDLRSGYARNFQHLIAAGFASILRQFSPDLRRPDPMIGRRKVAELCEWAALDRDDPVTIGDLAARCGLGLRALQKNFLRHFDTTPGEFLRNLRLEKARKLILSGAFTVTHAALEAGFVHLGHFSANYEKRFGELPSVTAAIAARTCVQHSLPE